MKGGGGDREREKERREKEREVAARGRTLYEGSKNRSTPLGKGRPASDRVLSLEKYQFNRKKRVKDNSSFSAFQLAAAPIRSIQRRCCLVVYLSGNLGRTPGYLSRKYLQATVQKPNLVCGRLILSYYIPSVDSSGLDPLLRPSLLFPPSFERTSSSVSRFACLILLLPFGRISSHSSRQSR